MPLQVYIVLPSKHTVKVTIDRLVILLQRSDMTIYARVNRQIEARWYGRVARPLEFILFDDPRLSAPMIDKNPILALCFPVRIIAWEDEIGRCRIAYKDPEEFRKEFHLDKVDFKWPDIREVIGSVLSE
jgi:uncharacterized protein (DUF302 family)